MAVREQARERVLQELAAKLCAAIRCMEDGSQESIGHLVSRYYRGKGYELHWLDSKHGTGWTKDGGKTFSVCHGDLFAIQEAVTKALEGEIELDYSMYDGLDVGLPFSLWFTVRKIRA